MSALATHLQKHRTYPTVTESVTNNRQTRKKTTCSPGNRQQIPLKSAKNSTALSALGAGDRWFKSGHPEKYFFLLSILTLRRLVQSNTNRLNCERIREQLNHAKVSTEVRSVQTEEEKGICLVFQAARRENRPLYRQNNETRRD